LCRGGRGARRRRCYEPFVVIDRGRVYGVAVAKPIEKREAYWCSNSNTCALDLMPLAWGYSCATRSRGFVLHLSNESLIVIIIVGIVAGWLAGQIVRGGGFGLIGDLIVGIIGAFIGDWLSPRLNIHLGVGTVALIINATIGAIALLIIIRLLAGNRGWGGGWGRRRW
jgi:uncharacterized membrane protein YeaQ/YmgE (transglycosylase-associated protein family)